VGSVLAVFVFSLVLATTVYAAKRVFRARLSADNELHDVVLNGPPPTGTALFGTSPNGTGFQFQVFVRGLSGTPGGVHLHAPATTEETAPVVLTLCGSPTPSVLGPCQLDSDGNLDLSGVVTSGALLQGITPSDFSEYLLDGQVYINAHTPMNPAGEARGQLTQIFP
jgi:hypothetical protein